MNKLKKTIYTIFNKKPGRRFLFAYRATNRYISDSPILKLITLLFGIVILLAGLVFLIIPGPGIIFILLGSVLLCMVSRRIATGLDKLEKNINSYFNINKE